jgi:autotransporter-associated beta strand protein
MAVACSKSSLVGLVLAGSLLGITSLNAATVTWDGGGGDGKWGTGTNWDTNSVPGVSDTAVLGAAATAVSVAASTAVGTVNFGSAATGSNTLTLNSNLRIATGITVDSGSSFAHTISSGRTLNLGNSGSSLTGTSTVTFTNSSSHLLTFTDTGGTNISNGAIQMGATGTGGATMTLAFAGSGSFAVGQKINQAASANASTFNLAKSGAGALTLGSAYNTYNGTTTVSAGSLWVNGTHTGGGAYSVTGAVLGGAGTIATAGNAGVTVGAGGKLSAGSAAGSIGTLTLNLGAGALDLSGALAGDSGSLFFQLGAAGASDKIVLGTGTGLNIGAGVLNFGDFAFSAEAGFGAGVYTLFESSTTITGSLLSGQLSGTIGGLDAALSLSGDSKAILLTVAAIPEPASLSLLLGGLSGAGILIMRRRQRAIVRARL